MTAAPANAISWLIPREGASAIDASIYLPVGASRVASGERPTLVLAHGAGAGQRHRAMVDLATSLAARGLEVVTFDFPYITAGRRLPDRAPALEQAWRDVIDHVAARGRTRTIIGGRSMGGRMATHVLAADRPPPSVAGVVLLGYPLHPPRRPMTRRDTHLRQVAVPMLFVQGDRDAFGGRDDLEALVAALGPRASLHVVAGADHGFRVTRRVTAEQGDVMARALDAVADWVVGRVSHGAGVP